MNLIGRSLLTCPVDGCEWELDHGIMDKPGRYVMPINPTPEDVTASINAAATKRAELVEASVREHAESHDVLDFLRTINRLQQDLAQQSSGIRPHVYRPTRAWDTP
jgi:hypothetical protein